MIKNIEICAIIPARSGSKQIKHKNIFKFNGKPSLYYSIKAAKLSKKINKIVFSSDSKKYLSIASKYKPHILHLRSKVNSRSTATDLDFLSEIYNLDTIDEENEEENEEIKMEVSETNEEETSQHSESSEEIKVEGSELNEQEKEEGIKVESSELNEEETSQHSESSEEKKLEGSETNEEEISQHSESSEEKNLEGSETNEIENEVKKKLSIELPDESVFELPKKYEVPSIKKSFDCDTNDNFSDSNSPDYKENNITQFVNEVE